MNVVVAPQVQAGGAGDRAAIHALLAAARLPVEDLDEPADLGFWVVRDGRQVVGAVGLERYDAVGLLRSLVVAPEHRKRGLGLALVAALERDAQGAGIELLVLLTQTAEPFFARLGYSAVDRAYVPEEVKASAEFRSLCPASAICMTRSLVSSGPGVPHG
jgi:amino-acid N-acetyltransferase